MSLFISYNIRFVYISNYNLIKNLFTNQRNYNLGPVNYLKFLN